MQTDSPFIVRPVTIDDAAALAHVLIAGLYPPFRGIVPDASLNFSEAESAANWRLMLEEGFEPGHFMDVVQTADGSVVAYAWGGPSDSDPLYQGEMKQLIILPEYWRQGIGRLLMRHVASRLAAQGITSMRVEVLRENPNRSFYEQLGGRYAGEHPYDWEGFPMVMYVYGWDDTRSLM